MTDEIQNPKKPYQSKTLWVALVSAVAAFVPGVQKLIAEHPEAYIVAQTGLFAALRFISKGAIDID